LTIFSIGTIAKLKAVDASTATTIAESYIETAERLERYLEDHECQDATTLVQPNSFITSLKEHAALFQEKGAKAATEQKECEERQG
jgi:phage tail sheath protein FI